MDMDMDMDMHTLYVRGINHPWLRRCGPQLPDVGIDEPSIGPGGKSEPSNSVPDFLGKIDENEVTLMRIQQIY